MRIINLLFLFVIGAVLTSCVNYEEVTLTDIKSIKILEIGNDGVILEAQLQLNNPNSYSIKVSESKFDVYIKGDKIGTASISSPLVLASNSNEYQSLQLETTFIAGQGELLTGIIAMSALSGGSIDLKLDGYIEGKAMFIKKRIDIVHEEKVPLNLFR